MKKYIVLYKLSSGWWCDSPIFCNKRKAKKYAIDEAVRTGVKHRVFKKI